MDEDIGGAQPIPQINYPPLFVERDHLEEGNALETKTDIFGLKVSKKSLFFIEWYLSNLAGVMFIVGSFLFNPKYNRETLRWAAVLFIVGSSFFMISAGIIFIRNNCQTFQDEAMSYNCILYILANSLFVIGSVFFLPKLDDEERFLIAGLFFFTVGSMLFFCAPFYSVYRLLQSEVRVAREYVFAEIAVALLFAAGNAMFIIGSILFMPARFHSDDFDYPALQLFIIGSFCFFIATFLLTIKQGVEELVIVLRPNGSWFGNLTSRVKTKDEDERSEDEEANWRDRGSSSSSKGSGISEVEVVKASLSVATSPAPTWKESSSPATTSTSTATESPLHDEDAEDDSMRAFVPSSGDSPGASPVPALSIHRDNDELMAVTGAEGDRDGGNEETAALTTTQA